MKKSLLIIAGLCLLVVGGAFGLSHYQDYQVFQAELFLNGEKVGEVKPEIPAKNYTFHGWQIWNLVKPMVEARNKLCVVLLLDKVDEQAVFDLYHQLCKKLDVDGVGFSRLISPDRLEINCNGRKKSKD